jgi:hypothetical protein
MALSPVVYETFKRVEYLHSKAKLIDTLKQSDEGVPKSALTAIPENSEEYSPYKNYEQCESPEMIDSKEDE